MKPQDITVKNPGTGSKKLWWKCENDHEWQATMKSRLKGSGCPYCSGLLSIQGETDLATTHPELAKQWHPTKNGDLSPSQIKAGSSKKVWWKCENGHEWQAIVNDRKGGSSCPYCSGAKVWAGFNDLATTHPELAKQWHPTKNGDLLPSQISAGSNKRVWWQCKKGHANQAAVISRASGYGCPYCSNDKVLAGFNDLATTHPELAKQWHPTKNGDLLPNQVIAGTGKKNWWRCEHGHEWETSPNSRALSGVGCPYCANRKVLAGYNDLATTHSELAEQWHPTKNGDLLPTQIVAGSNKKVWWKYTCGHEFEKSVREIIPRPKCKVCGKDPRAV